MSTCLSAVIRRTSHTGDEKQNVENEAAASDRLLQIVRFVSKNVGCWLSLLLLLLVYLRPSALTTYRYGTALATERSRI